MDKNTNKISICWTCRGLLTEEKFTKSDTELHKLHCKAKNNPRLTEDKVDLFACDKKDYIVITELKQALSQARDTLTLCNETALRNVIPISTIKSLINMCIIDESDCIIIKSKSEPWQPSSKNCDTEEHTDAMNLKDEQQKARTFPNENNLLTEAERNKLTKECDFKQDSNFHVFICNLCQYRSKSSKIMLRHLHSHNNGQPFQCFQCNFSTVHRSQWNRHQCRHAERNCRTVKDSTKSVLKGMKSHPAVGHSAEKEITKTLKHVCETCTYVGRDLASLKEHQRKHTGEILRCCHANCNFKTMYKRSLLKHQQQKHSVEKSHICDVCGFQTRYAASLKKHLLLHTSFKPYHCVQCSFTSFSPSEILHHVERKHLKQKKYSCPRCSFQSGYALAMKKHIMRHEKADLGTGKGDQAQKIQQYSCSECGLLLNSIKKVKEHIATCHKASNDETISTGSREQLANKTADGNSLTRNTEDYDGKAMNFDALLDIANETLDLTDNILGAVGSRRDFERNNEPQTIGQTSLTQPNFSKEQKNSSGAGNPMLSASSDVLGDADNSLIEESVFDLMSDFPRPPSLYRCQSASTLMFASLSPHMTDRPLTPDIFSDSPAHSFFQNFHPRNMESDALTVPSFVSLAGQSTQGTQVPTSVDNNSNSTNILTQRNMKVQSPVLPPTFACFPAQTSSHECPSLSSTSLGVVSSEPDCLL